MITKIRISGTKLVKAPAAPPEAAWAKAGVTNIVVLLDSPGDQARTLAGRTLAAGCRDGKQAMGAHICTRRAVPSPG